MKRKANWRPSLPRLGLLLFLWAVSLTNLAQWPTIHNDSVSILAAGHKLFTQGVYGLDMYAGQGGREQLYLEVMPLMSWLQGLSTWLLGLGVWQMRFLPVIASMLTLALTAALAQKLAGRQAGVIAMLLLLFWRWAPGGAEFFGSGVALVDAARIARYDILVPLFSLAVLWCWLQAKQRGDDRFAILSGVSVGLAGLSHIYSLFWLPVLLLLEVGELWLLRRSDWRLPGRLLLAMLVGFTAVFAIWPLLVFSHWELFQQQFAIHNSRFALFTLSFYVNNLSQEPQRYFLGLRELQSLWRLGFWFVIIGLPLALLWLGRMVWRQQLRPAWWLWLPCLLLPLLLALLVQKKNFTYLLIVMPLWVTAVAWLLAHLYQSTARVGRLIITVLLTAVVAEGGVSIWQMQRLARSVGNPHEFFAALHNQIPEEGLVLGPQTYWFALPNGRYRAATLPFRQLDGRTSFTTLLEDINPQFIILNPTVRQWLTHMDNIEPVVPTYEAQFEAYLAAQKARLTAELIDHEGNLVQLYQLE